MRLIFLWLFFSSVRIFSMIMLSVCISDMPWMLLHFLVPLVYQPGYKTHSYIKVLWISFLISYPLFLSFLKRKHFVTSLIVIYEITILVYMTFLPLAKTYPLCFEQFSFITVNMRQWVVKLTIIKPNWQKYSGWVFASGKNVMYTNRQLCCIEKKDLDI